MINRATWLELLPKVRAAAGLIEALAAGYVDTHGKPIGDPVQAADHLAAILISAASEAKSIAAAAGKDRRKEIVKDNCYILNCRQHICEAIRCISIQDRDGRRELFQALSELDSFRHGQLQRCESGCADVGVSNNPEGP